MKKMCNLGHFVELLPAYRSYFNVFMMSQRPTDVNSGTKYRNFYQFIKTNLTCVGDMEMDLYFLLHVLVSV